MALRDMTQFSSAQIRHCAARQLLQVEASTLWLRPGHVWEQIYDDACDVGIALRNPRNGNVTRWYMCESETVDDGDDILYWVLKPTHETLRTNRMLEGYKFHIYND